MTKKIALLKSGAGRAGGLEKYTLKLAQAFREKGCDITLLTTGKAPAEFQALSLESTSKLSFLKLQQFDQFCKKTIDRLQPDLIFGMDRNRMQTHLRAGNGVHAAYLERRAKHSGILKRASFALNPLHKTILQMEKEAFESPELKQLFTNSHMVKKEILDHYQVKPEKISVVHNGVEWKEFEKPFQNWPAEREKLQKELNLDSALFHFLFVGHNFQRKGLDQLLKALSLVSARDFHLSVIGEDKNLTYYKELVEKLQLTGKVTFFGKRSDCIRFYQMADALVIPSLYDPFANVTLEALAFGVFVLSSKNNGGHEVLTAENGALLPSLEDPDAVAQVLSDAIKRPKNLRMAETIRESVKHLDFSHQLNALVEQCLS